MYGKKERRMNSEWFIKYPKWLEYSIEKDAVFCLCCYLFKHKDGKESGHDAFVKVGYSNWNKMRDRLDTHVGGPNSAHNKCLKKCDDLLNEKQSIGVALNKQTDKTKRDYRMRLEASIDCLRFLLKQGHPCRGHDETELSHNRGNFLELLDFLACHNEDINGVVLNNAPQNNKLTSPKIQKDIINAASIETTNVILKDLGDKPFAILVDESRDISNKEQMAIVLRYVDDSGSILERFLGVVHVTQTTSVMLKSGIEQLLAKHELCLSRLRGQGYDGASNMRGEYNGLKSLILKENPCAYFVHCFAHQLQLCLVSVARNHKKVEKLFMVINDVVNVAAASCKRQDKLREVQASKVCEALDNGEIESGQGLNQETSLKRPGDTRWSSHYGTLVNLMVMFSSVIEVLDFVSEEAEGADKATKASDLVDAIQTFEFIFTLHLMKKVLGITNELSQALQKKDQNIVNALKLVDLAKQKLQEMRENGWDSLLEEASSFCAKFDVDVPSMDSMYLVKGRAKRFHQEKLCLHYFRVELFYTVIDMQMQELNSRFSEGSTELLSCTSCLDPSDKFSAFDKQKLIRLAEFYPIEFSTPQSLIMLESQLETYILDMRSSDDFSNVKGIGDLAKKLVATKKHITYPLVYLLLTLVLILPVATATVERLFSGMKILKDRLRNRMGDGWLNDCLVTYMEKDVFRAVTNEAIIDRFQKMKSRRGQI